MARPNWKRIFTVKERDAAALKAFDDAKRALAQHLVDAEAVPPPEPGFRVILGLTQLSDGIISWDYLALPKAKEMSEKDRLQRELEEARLELERLKAEAAKPRLVKAKA